MKPHNILGFLIAPLLIGAASAQLAVPTTHTVRVKWNPNPEPYLAGYRIHWGNVDGGPWPNVKDVGNVTNGEFVVEPGFVASVATAYSTDYLTNPIPAHESEPSDQVTGWVKRYTIEVSSDKVTWSVVTDSLGGFLEPSDTWTAKPKNLVRTNSHRFRRINFPDDPLYEPPIELPDPSDPGIYIAWDPPRYSEDTEFYKVWKLQGEEWIEYQTVLLPEISCKVEAGTYSVTAHGGLEISERSESIIIEADVLTAPSQLEATRVK